MTSGALIHASAVLEPWVATIAVASLVVLVADWLRAGRRGGPAPSLDAAMSYRTERRLLMLIVVVAMLLRLVGWDWATTPLFWFCEISTLHIDHEMRDGTLWANWIRELHETQVIGPHDSAIMLPVIAAFQMLIGPRFGLPALTGALFGGIAVVFAWALGRRVRSQAFGLMLAWLVACSPLTLMWSRMSGFITAATAHLLLAMLIGWEAGRRGSVLLAIATGLVAWASIYQYYPARLAVPLGIAAILAGSQRAWRLPRGIVLATITVGVFFAVALLLHGHASIQALWPSYGGYAGNKGERTLAEFVASNLASFKAELGNTLERYFMLRRSGWQSDVRRPGIENGGLVLVPIAVLGLVGLVAIVRHPRRRWLWLLLAAAGLAVPTLSVMTARRVLLLDLAWCAFAAHGLLALVDGLAAHRTRATRARIVAIVLAVVGAWSAAAVFVLSAALPATAGQHIPFGDAGFGDGVACRRCAAAAKSWVPAMAAGAFVVLFDNDTFRENRTAPGGLVAYGKIATLEAGAPDRFVEGYSLMAAFDGEPPSRGAMYDRDVMDFVTYFTTQLERTRSTWILWHFERPTSWERWLAGRLVAAGGKQESFATALSPVPGLRVVTPPERVDDAIAILRELAKGFAPEDESSCVTVAERSAFTISSPIRGVAAGGPGITTPPDWIATSYEHHRFKSLTLWAPLTIAAWASPEVDGASRVELLAETGERVGYALPSLRRAMLPPVADGVRFPINCAAYAAGHWWIVNPWTDRVVSKHPAAAAVPRGDWMGITADPSGNLVLASGDQWIVVFDPEQQREVARFPARVSPAVRETTDECAPVAVGADWIATLDRRTTVLSVYDRAGRDLGTRRLDRIIRQPYEFVTIAGAGHYLGVGVGHAVRTIELRIAPACAATDRAGSARPTEHLSP